MLFTPSQGRLSITIRLLAAAFVLTSCGLLFYTSHYYTQLPKHLSTPYQAWSVWTQSWHQDVGKLIPNIWKPFLHDIDDLYLITDRGKEYNISEANYRIERGSKKVLIIDVDSRLDLSEGAILNPDPVNAKTMKGRTGGILNHFLYATIHGYDYKLVRPPNYEDRHGTWVKVPIIREALKTYDVVVFLDADAVFQQMHVPLEWLMRLWNMHPGIITAMAEDPNSKGNRDEKDWVLWNTGFIVAQRNNRTQDMFNEWEDCPTGRQHPHCTKWARDWAHEQSAMGNFIRYQYNTTDELRVIPCGDGNGSPNRGGPLCAGNFVAHHWFDKHAPVDELYAMLSDQLVRRLHRYFHEKKDKFFLDVSHLKHPLNDLVI
jgi:hypothetical protein